MRIIYMGTPEFAVPCLEKIIEMKHDVCAVFTRPDRPKGRGMALAQPAVKLAAARHGIPVYQPEAFKDGTALNKIRELAPDLIVVTAYGRILPETVLRVPPLGCINIHASLLPKYRGAAPIQWAVINGETVTGVTVMYMAEGIDTGDMILKEETDIDENETAGELRDRLMTIGAHAFGEALPLLETGRADRIRQDDQQASNAPMLDKTMAVIDWGKSASEIHNAVRGMNPWPVAYTTLNSAPFKIFRTEKTEEKSALAPGEIVRAGKDGLFVACGDGHVLAVKEVQAQGGKKMSSTVYLVGHRIEAGGLLGK